MVRPATAEGCFSRGGIPAGWLLLAAIALAQPALADEFDTFNVRAGSLLRYESNIFRSPDNTPPQPGTNQKNDTVSVSYVGLYFDKQYSLQRFQLSAVDTLTRYNAFSFLDNNALDYRTAWLWSISPHFTGTLSADRTQSQIPFALVGGTQRNLLTLNNRNFTFDATVSGAWHLIGGYGQTDSKTEVPQLTAPSFNSHRVEGGLRYVSNAGNTVSLVQRWIPASLSDQPLNPATLIDTEYRDTETDLRGFWKVTGHSTFEGRAVRKQRTNEHFAQRNFAGLAGELRYIWTPTGKLRLSAALTRDILPYAAFGNVLENSTYRLDNTLSLLGVWQATGKITVQANMLRTHSDFRGPVFAVTAPAREDTLTIVSLRADWAIARAVSLNANLERDERTSNIPGFQFTNTLFSVGASVLF